MDDLEFRELLHSLGRSWKGYRKVRKGVKKRIFKHMRSLGCRNLRAYLVQLETSEEARRECDRLMTVSISRFFRERKLWEVLQEEILPDIIRKEAGKVMAWSAGCASGEEVYTLKIVWNRLRGDFISALPALEIIGTDLNPLYLERARRGIYPASSLKEVPGELRFEYFDPKPQQGQSLYRVKDFLKERIVWKVQDLLADPSGIEFHLIFLRNNLLTYYEAERKTPAFKKILGRLRPGGYLVVGSHETLPFEPDDLAPLGSCPCVFRKNP